MSDLAELLRDWRLTDCDHTSFTDSPMCCSPCLRDRILASEWLAKVKAEAWDQGFSAGVPMPTSATNPYRDNSTGGFSND